MTEFEITIGLFRQASPLQWPRLVWYFLGRFVHRVTGVMLFGQMPIRLRELSFVADVGGMSGLVFLHQILVQNIYAFPALSRDRTARVLFDVGANCGFYALTSCRRHAEWRAYCFEPQPATFAKLTQNIAENRLTERVFPVQAAAGASSGSCALSVSDQSSMGVVTQSGMSLVDRKGRPMPAREITVPLLTLDGFAAERQVWPDVLKVDVEGFEVEVLKGAASCLRRARYAIVEFDSQPNGEACVALLREAGFELVKQEVLIFAHRPAA